MFLIKNKAAENQIFTLNIVKINNIQIYFSMKRINIRFTNTIQTIKTLYLLEHETNC